MRQHSPISAAGDTSISMRFGLTQNLGALMGASLIGAFQIVRAKYHSATIADRLAALDPAVAARFAQSGGTLAHTVTDPLARLHLGAGSLAEAAVREASILAYNHVSMVVALIVLLLTASFGGRALWTRLAIRGPGTFSQP